MREGLVDEDAADARWPQLGGGRPKRGWCQERRQDRGPCSQWVPPQPRRVIAADHAIRHLLNPIIISCRTPTTSTTPLLILSLFPLPHRHFFSATTFFHYTHSFTLVCPASSSALLSNSIYCRFPRTQLPLRPAHTHHPSRQGGQEHNEDFRCLGGPLRRRRLCQRQFVGGRIGGRVRFRDGNQQWISPNRHH